jgi:hypothetical protein
MDGVGALARLRGAESKDTQRSFPIRPIRGAPIPIVNPVTIVTSGILQRGKYIDNNSKDWRGPCATYENMQMRFSRSRSPLARF